MIERMQLTNFQIHRTIEVEFDPQVTMFIGDSDQGKSTLLRALRWICLNQIGGKPDAVIHWDATWARGKLWVDGHTIVRRRGKGENYYKLDKQRYDAIARDVPPDIATLLNLGDVNFQQQLDAHFWFSNTPGQVSQKLNQIVNLGVIDETLSRVSTQLRSSRAAVEVSNKRLAEAREVKKSLAFVPKLYDQAMVLHQQNSDLKTKQATVADVKSKVQNGQGLRRTIKNTTAALTGGRFLVELGEKALASEKRARKLETLLSNVAKAKKAQTYKVPDMTQLRELHVAVINSRNKVNLLADLIKKINSARGHVLHNTGLLAGAEYDLEKAAKELKTCPTCGAILKSSPS